MATIAVAGLTAFGTAVAQATDYTFIDDDGSNDSGGSPTSWQNSNNWSPQGVPGSAVTATFGLISPCNGDPPVSASVTEASCTVSGLSLNAGATLTLAGANFRGTTQVTFNGNGHPSNATVPVLSDTQLRVAVPAGATSGTATVASLAGKATTAQAVTISP